MIQNKRNDYGHVSRKVGPVYHYRNDMDDLKQLGWVSLIASIFIIVVGLIILLAMPKPAHAQVVAPAYSNEQIANAIYLAEGGAKTRHPYGILAKYKHTTPRQACINTIKSAKRRYEKSNQRIDFVTFLSLTYCPIGAKNDPTGLNKNWVKNVKYFLNK